MVRDPDLNTCSNDSSWYYHSGGVYKGDDFIGAQPTLDILQSYYMLFGSTSSHFQEQTNYSSIQKLFQLILLGQF